MNIQMKKQKGVTLIVLVVTVIITLVLVGVAISVGVGDNGVINQTQNATFMHSKALLEDYLNAFYADNCEYISESDNKVLALQQNEDSTDWIYNPSQFGIGSLNYISNADGDALYLINKSALPTDLKDQIIGGDAGGNEYMNYLNLKDVYGITSDLKVYYCSDGKDTIVGLDASQIDKDDEDREVFTQGSALGTLITGNASTAVTVADIKTVKQLTINAESGIINLSELYNLTSLQELYLENLTLDSLDGLQNCGILKYISFKNCTIGDVSQMSGVQTLEYLYILGTNDAQVESIINAMSGTDYPKLTYIGVYNNTTNVTDISCFNNLTPTTKAAVKYLYLQNNRLTSVAALSGFVNVVDIDLYSNSTLTSLKGLDNMTKLKYLDAYSCNLGANEDANAKNPDTDALAALANCIALKEINIDSNPNLKWVGYMENLRPMRFYLRYNQNYVISDVILIRYTYNLASFHGIHSKYEKYLSTEEVINYKESSLTDTSEDIQYLLSLPAEDKLKVKVIDLSSNPSLSDSKMNEVLSGGFTNAFSIRLTGNTNLTTLDFLQYTPNLKELRIRSTSVGSTAETGGEFKKIDLYARKLKSLDTSSDNINIEDIKDFVVRCSQGLESNSYYANTYNYFYAKPYVTEQFSKITNFGPYFRIMGLSVFGTPSNPIDLTANTGLTSILVDAGYTFILPSSLTTISEVQSLNHNDISNCVNLKSIAFNPGYFRDDTVEWYFKQIYDYNLTNINRISLSRYAGTTYIQDFGTMTDYLKNTNIETFRITTYSATHYTQKFKGTFNFNDDPATDIVEFSNLKNLTLQSVENLDTSGIANCTSLTTLSLTYCDINTTEHLANLTNLTSLDLSNNAIADISYLSNMKNLVTLKLTNNCLYDDALDVILDLNKNGKLKNLYIDGNTSIINIDKLNEGTWSTIQK